MRIFTLIFLLVVLNSCSKDLLPEDVNLGEFVILVNGRELTGFGNRFNYRASSNLIDISFSKIKNESMDSVYFEHAESISFRLVPFKEGIYEISYPESLNSYDYDNIGASYNNLYDYDLMGYPYNLDDPETAFFEISALDTNNHTGKGSFNVRFKHRDRSGVGSDRGRKLHFEGIFYDYTVE